MILVRNHEKQVVFAMEKCGKMMENGDFMLVEGDVHRFIMGDNGHVSQ
jgi:hypothetical protein